MLGEVVGVLGGLRQRPDVDGALPDGGEVGLLPPLLLEGGDPLRGLPVGDAGARRGEPPPARRRGEGTAERLTALVGAHIRHLLRRRVEFLVGLHERSSLTPDHRAEIDGYLHFYNRRVRDVLAAGMRGGEFRELNPSPAALGLLDMLNGVSSWIRGEEDADTDEVVETYTAMLFDGLGDRDRRPT
ncbi:hypothetical protein [Pseudonocardia sp. N23]|uniref:hypothetical protein n=1 Tax=Pseudonocardia sp. N23 TaxID=1987376 RepID=UPI001C0F20A4|nr:hypothetical protein [Pseudonocardia sp. N23]